MRLGVGGKTGVRADMVEREERRRRGGCLYQNKGARFGARDGEGGRIKKERKDGEVIHRIER